MHLTAVQMQKTLQSLKHDVVDQEVAVMNTLTSDQCSEIDVNQLSSHRQSESIRSQRDGKCSIKPPSPQFALDSEHSPILTARKIDYDAQRNKYGQAIEATAGVLSEYAANDLDKMSPIMQAEKSTPMLFMLKQHSSGLNPSGGPQLAMMKMKQQLKPEDPSISRIAAESPILDSLLVSHQHASEDQLSNSTTVRGNYPTFNFDGQTKTNPTSVEQPKKKSVKQTTLQHILLQAGNSHQNYLRSKQKDLMSNQAPSIEQTMEKIVVSPEPPQKLKTVGLMANSTEKLENVSSGRTLNEAEKFEEGRESHPQDNQLSTNGQLKESSIEIVGKTRQEFADDKAVTPAKLTIEALTVPTPTTTYAATTKHAKKPSNIPKYSPTSLVKTTGRVNETSGASNPPRTLKKTQVKQNPAKCGNLKTLMATQDASKKQSAKVEREKPFQPYLALKIKKMQAASVRLRNSIPHTAKAGGLHKTHSSFTAKRPSKKVSKGSKTPNSPVERKIKSSMNQSRCCDEKNLARMSSQASQQDRSMCSTIRDHAFTAQNSPIKVAEEFKIKFHMSPSQQKERQSLLFGNDQSKFLQLEHYPSSSSPQNQQTVSTPNIVLPGKEKTTRFRSITERHAQHSSSAVHNKPRISNDPQSAKIQVRKSRQSKDIQLVQTVHILSPLSKTISKHYAVARPSNLLKSVSNANEVSGSSSRGFASSLVANESVFEARTPKVQALKQTSLLKVICLKAIASHLSFRQVSMLMQLCRQTRFSSTLHKAQKTTYLDLLKKGQIDVEGVDQGRCRMWFQRLNIEISTQQAMKKRYKIVKQKLTASKGLNGCDLEIIEADLRRSDFTMPTGSLTGVATSQEASQSVEQIVSGILKRLSVILPCGYLQGMNYIVISIYRITKSAEMTYALVKRLFSDDRLTRVFLDESGKPMSEQCQKLKTFIDAYLPRLGDAMDKTGVETDFFAQTWFITLLFHFSLESSINSSHRRRHVNLGSKRIMESLILDFLCLDGPKSLIKVPLCAIQALETSPQSLDHIFFGMSHRSSIPSHNEKKENNRRRRLMLQRQCSGSSYHSESTVTLADDSDDESVRLISLIKKTAADYLTGHSQLRQITFKKNNSFFAFFQSEPSLEQREQHFLIKEFVERYKSFHVSKRLYVNLQAKRKMAVEQTPGQTLSANDVNLESQRNGAGPISILRADYFSGIKQGALSTFDIGCNLLGFASTSQRTAQQVAKKDEHHLSFTETSSDSIGDDKSGAMRNMVSSSSVQQFSDVKREASLIHGNSCVNLRAAKPPILHLKKVLSQRIKVKNLDGRTNESSEIATRKAIHKHKGITTTIQKQQQVTGDDESFDQYSTVTRSVRESLPGSAAKIFALPSHDPKEPIQLSPVIKLDSSSAESEKQSQGSSYEDSDLPQTEDLNETYQKTVIDTQIHTQLVTGSQAVILSPKSSNINVARLQGESIDSSWATKTNSSQLRAKPQCMFEKVPQQKKKLTWQQNDDLRSPREIQSSPSQKEKYLPQMAQLEPTDNTVEMSMSTVDHPVQAGIDLLKTGECELVTITSDCGNTSSDLVQMTTEQSPGDDDNRRLSHNIVSKHPMAQPMFTSKSIPNFTGLSQLLNIQNTSKTVKENERDGRRQKPSRFKPPSTLGELISTTSKMERSIQKQIMFKRRDLKDGKNGQQLKKGQAFIKMTNEVRPKNTLRNLQAPSLQNRPSQQQQPKQQISPSSRAKAFYSTYQKPRETNKHRLSNNPQANESFVGSEAHGPSFSSQEDSSVNNSASKLAKSLPQGQFQSQIAKAAKKAIISQLGAKKLSGGEYGAFQIIGGSVSVTGPAARQQSSGVHFKYSPNSQKQSSKLKTASLLKSWHDLTNN